MYGTEQTNKALQLIAKERTGQVEKGYDAAHDDGHPDGEIARGAAFYAKISTLNMHGRAKVRTGWGALSETEWPFEEAPRISAGDNNEDRIAELVKAGAMIVAEIERRLRNHE